MNDYELYLVKKAYNKKRLIKQAIAEYYNSPTPDNYIAGVKNYFAKGPIDESSPIDQIALNFAAQDAARNHKNSMESYVKHYDKQLADLQAAQDKLDASIEQNNGLYSDYNARVRNANDRINKYNDRLANSGLDALSAKRIHRTGTGAAIGGTAGAIGGHLLSRRLGLNKSDSKLKRLAGLGLTVGSGIGGAALGGYIGHKTVPAYSNPYAQVEGYKEFEPISMDKASAYRGIHKLASDLNGFMDDHAFKPTISKPIDPSFFESERIYFNPSFDTSKGMVSDYYSRHKGAFEDDDALNNSYNNDIKGSAGRLAELADMNAEFNNSEYSPRKRHYTSQSDAFDAKLKNRDDNFDKFRSTLADNMGWHGGTTPVDRANTVAKNNSDFDNNRYNALNAYKNIGSGAGAAAGLGLGYAGSNWLSKKLGLKGQKGWRRAADIALQLGGSGGGAYLGYHAGNRLGSMVGDKLLPTRVNGLESDKIDVNI